MFEQNAYFENDIYSLIHVYHVLMTSVTVCMTTQSSVGRLLSIYMYGMLCIYVWHVVYICAYSVIASELYLH